MRTIDAPGVEIREYDLSQYSQTLTGTKVLVAGFASKGQDYVTQQPTSRSSLLNMYGEPKSEAERYFYTACMEVINQGGVLYSAKLPYDNALSDDYIKVEYNINFIPTDLNGLAPAITSADATVDQAIVISSVNDPNSSPVSILTNSQFNSYELGESKPSNLTIVDISRSKYGKTINKTDGYNQEIIGIIPIVTTAANALYYQMLLDTDADGADFNAVSSITSLSYSDLSGTYEGLSSTFFTVGNDDLAIALGVEKDDETYPDCVSLRAAAQFPALFFDENGKLDREHLKKIGIVVFKAYTDVTNGNRINFELVESFVGEIDSNATDPTTGATTFIDAIVNNSSEYIRCFSPTMDKTNLAYYNRADILFIKDQTAGSLGAYESMTKKNISLNESILKGLQRVFDNNSDINQNEIDIVVDAGMSTIAQYIDLAYTGDPKSGEYFGQTLIQTATAKITGATQTSTWRAVLNKFDNFCKNVRKDCMYISDIPRAFGIQGTKKIIRPSKPTHTIDSDIIPALRYTAGTNSNYGAGYSVWFEVMDDFTGETFWCPPSIQAAGIYINTDKNYHIWDAPAGLTRGIVTNALDTTFSPNMKQAGSIYLKNWNYAITYPTEGVILEGQKTFQTKPSAFDRVNVRRLFLRLERYAYKIARYYVYEPNNSYTRQRFVDQLTPYFNEIKNTGGIYDFYIICDETINTPEVIDNNELKCRIGIKPTKTIEFIEIQFVALRTGGSWEEMITI